MISNSGTIIRCLINRPRYNFTAIRLNSKISDSVDIEKLEKESEAPVEVVSDEILLREQEIERKRNKSRLKEPDYNFLHEKDPYPVSTFWHHGTLKYRRRLYGRYGSASGVDPAICWPVKEELEDAKEYERVAYPFTIPQMIADAKQRKIEKEDKIRARQEEIVKKMEKLEQWKTEFVERVSKKEREANEAKQRKNRLIEEVRRHFGFTVDPKDERFQEMLAKKEKEQKKAMKEAKKLEREAKMVEKFLKKGKQSDTKTEEQNVNENETK